MLSRFLPIVSACCLMALPTATQAQTAAAIPAPTRADLADLSTRSPLILRASVDKAKRIRGDAARNVPEGFARLLVRADVKALLVGRTGVPERIEYLVDLPLDARGKPPKIKDREVLLFLNAEAAPGQFALAHKYGQVDWTAQRESAVRQFAAQASGSSLLTPRGVKSAFHVVGTLPGESETQFFVDTDEGRPMSIVVLSRPNQPKRFAVATGDIIDPNAEAPDPDSLTALYLSCGLPDVLPETVTEDADMADALRRDYQFVRSSLPSCERYF